MFTNLVSILSRVNADYSDIRYEIKSEVIISFNGRELTQLSSNSTDGYVVRILNKGGLSSVAFSDRKDANKVIKSAEENALLISKNIDEPVRFTESKIVVDSFLPKLKENPQKITIDEKLSLTKKYNGIPLCNHKIATTNISYHEIIRDKYFANTEGSKIREQLTTTRINGSIISRDGNLLQNVRVGIGGSNGFAVLRNKEDEFEKRTSIALQLLKASPVKAGVYNAILNQSLAGVFTHEAFGHFSEADLIENNVTMREKMKLGEKLGNRAVSIIDDPTVPDLLGYYKYDDEGTKVRPTQLMKNGVLVGRLHSRRTAAAFKEPLTGHCVAEDYRYAPIIRMGNIFIQPGKYSFNDLLDKLGDGLYILDAKGGQTSGENFTFGAQYGYQIKNGKINKMVRDINVSGNLYKTLQNINAIGNDVSWNKIGGCGKGQMNIRSCYGAPHILVGEIVVGGR
ncbi:MAG: TldD/PmbA family protein [bacterium]